MKTIEYRYADKSDWGAGAWQDEPDKRQWIDEATGLPCLIVRSPLGALCGYVGVPEGHPYFLADYDEVPVAVHGGLTFGNVCIEGKDGHGICHVVEPGEDDRAYWLGFDCAHLNDYVPAMESSFTKAGLAWPGVGMFSKTYKPFPYVEAEVARLAGQLDAIKVSLRK